MREVKENKTNSKPKFRPFQIICLVILAALIFYGGLIQPRLKTIKAAATLSVTDGKIEVNKGPNQYTVSYQMEGDAPFDYVYGTYATTPDLGVTWYRGMSYKFDYTLTKIGEAGYGGIGTTTDGQFIYTVTPNEGLVKLDKDLGYIAEHFVAQNAPPAGYYIASDSEGYLYIVNKSSLWLSKWKVNDDNTFSEVKTVNFNCAGCPSASNIGLITFDGINLHVPVRVVAGGNFAIYRFNRDLIKETEFITGAENYNVTSDGNYLYGVYRPNSTDLKLCRWELDYSNQYCQGPITSTREHKGPLSVGHQNNLNFIFIQTYDDINQHGFDKYSLDPFNFIEHYNGFAPIELFTSTGSYRIVDKLPSGASYSSSTGGGRIQVCFPFRSVECGSIDNTRASEC